MSAAAPGRPHPSANSASSREARLFVISLLAVTLLSLGLRLYRLDYESLWMDELVTVETYHYRGVPLIEKAADLGQPPLDNLIGAALAAAGLVDSDWWVRLPAALFGGGAVLLFGLVVRRMSGSGAGLTAALLLAVCPFHQYMSQEARPYTIFVCLGLATVLAYLWARARNRTRPWFGFGVLLFLTLMTRWVDPHFITLGLVVYSGIALAAAPRDIVERRRFGRMAISSVAAYAAYAPFFWVVLSHSRSATGGRGGDIGAHAAAHLSAWFLAAFHGYSTRTIFAAWPGPTWDILLGGALAGVGLLALLIRARRGGGVEGWFAPTALVPFPVAYALVFAMLGNALPKPQYLLFGVVALFALIAVGIDAARVQLARVHRRWGGSVSAVLVIAMLAPMTEATWESLQRADKQDWRGVMSHLRTHSGPDDAFAVMATDTIPTAYHVAAYGRSRYGLGNAAFFRLNLDADPGELSSDPWTREENALWVVGYTDRRYTGHDELPPPRLAGATVHLFQGLFLVECHGARPASDRLLDVLAEIYAQLPEGSSLTAPAVLAARLEAERGSAIDALDWLRIASGQCRDRVELDLLERDWIGPLRAELEATLRVEHHTRANERAGPAQPLSDGQSLVE